MTKILLPGKLKFLPAALIIIFVALAALAQTPQPWSVNTSPLPAPTGFVNDYAGVIDAPTKQQLEKRLREFKEKTNPPVEIAVAVVRTTGDRPIFDYSLATARGWKIGSKLDDNPGALLFVAVDDRKYFTQVSKDLEDELPDGLVGNLQRQYLVPEFKKGNYGKGIADTIEAYIAAIEKKTLPAAPSTAPAAPSGNTVPRSAGSTGTGVFSAFCCGLVILGIILLIVSQQKRGGPTKSDRDRWGGGGFGGGGRSDVGSNIASAIVGGLIGSALSGGSSSSSSSDSSWGGSSGGDFGGFGGGGDFGGGGAGGDW